MSLAIPKSPWLIVLGSAIALVVGNGPVMQFTFGVFLKPISEEFGVDRGVASFALTVGLLSTALALPFVGRLADKIGPQRCGLIAVALLAMSLAAIALLANSIWSFMALFAIAGVAAAGQTPLPYTKAVAASFDRNRGLALALTLTGVGIGSIVIPPISQALVSAYGWRGGYLGISGLLLIIAVPALLLFIPKRVAAPRTQETGAQLEGLTVREAVRSRVFWLLIVALFLGAGAANGTIAHVIPLLTDRGVSPSSAVGAMAWVGAASIVGRILGGFLIDRFWAPAVALIFFAGMICGIGILLVTSSTQLASVATILLGLGLGLEADLVGFLISRYLGNRCFGAFFGYVFGAFILASSLGPMAMGAVFAQTGSYSLCLAGFIGATALSAATLLMMGRYRFAAAERPVAAAK